MKRILFAASFLFLICSCKKDKPAKEKALSKVFQDGALLYEFLYSSQKKMVRLNEYDQSSGMVDYASTFEYDASGHMVLVYEWNKAGKKTAKAIYSWNADKCEQQDYMPLSGTDSGKITVRIKYDYDTGGRLTKEGWVDVQTGVPLNANELTYYDNGNIRASSDYNYSPGPVLQFRLEYAAGDPVPASLLKFKAYPIDYMLFDFTAPEQRFYQYNGVGAVTNQTSQVFSNRQFDQGYVLEQTQTIKKVIPAGPELVRQWRYEYIGL